ncbi:MAG: hypothetical protein QMD12_03100 [Candidatus Aenigmarchaeota archaeon]|nr:hypothetical protein [Candidatus Aenigmarchaeota archaeon]
MTGRAEGKLELRRAKVFLATEKEKIQLKDAIVYIHLKGYSLARVSHLDVEHDVLDNIVPPKRGEFLSIHGIKDGIEIKIKKEVEFRKKKISVTAIEVLHSYLTEVLKQGEKTRTWVGGKFGGIYIGFRKKEIEKLEEIAREKFQMEPA